MKVSTASFLLALALLVAALSVHVHRFGLALKKVGPGYGWKLPILGEVIPAVTVPILIGLAAVAMGFCISASRHEKRRDVELLQSEVEQ